MGKHELEHLRKEAEQAIADAGRWSGNAGWAAVAKTLMYVGELLADRVSTAKTATEALGTAMQVIPTDEWWDCSFCNRSFPSESSLSMHVCKAAIR